MAKAIPNFHRPNFSLTITSSNSGKELDHLFDSVESNVKSLASLGVESRSYGVLISLVLISKIPQEVQLIMTKQL